MKPIIVNSESSARAIWTLIKGLFIKHKFISIKIDFNKRSIISNALQFHWYRELAQQGDMTANEYRRHCKYYYGCALRAANDEFFAKVLKDIITRHTLEDRLKMMDLIDITSTFDRPTMSEYLNEINIHFSKQEFVLTNSKDLEEQREKDLKAKKKREQKNAAA